MRVRQVWGRNGSVAIHAVEWAPDSGSEGIPLVCMHGAVGNAWGFIREGEAAATGMLGGRPRKLLAIDRRGMGLSEAPERGYKLTDFAEDIHAAVRAADLRGIVLFGHSLGVPVVLQHALEHPELARGLILGDYPARYPKLSADWVDRVLAGPWSFPDWESAFAALGPKSADPNQDRARWEKLREHLFREAPDGSIVARLAPDGIRRMSEESEEVLLWGRLDEITCPVLVLTGTAGVILTREDLERYRLELSLVRVAVIEGADHRLRIGADYGPTDRQIGDFLSDIDAR